MAWIESRKKKDGSTSYFIRDVKDDKQVVISLPEGTDLARANEMKERYELRRGLDKKSNGDGLA